MSNHCGDQDCKICNQLFGELKEPTDTPPKMVALENNRSFIIETALTDEEYDRINRTILVNRFLEVIEEEADLEPGTLQVGYYEENRTYDYGV